jgi:low affinity Fe/Cu permease
MSRLFQRLAQRTARAAGSAWAFTLAVLVIIIWTLTGPVFGFSDTWQLVINTGTTIVTFLMVFLIQNSQNRDTRAIHLKLDELLRAVEKAREARFVDLEDATEEKLELIKREIEAECRAAEASAEAAQEASGRERVRLAE